MSNINRRNACKELTDRIIKQSSQGLKNLTTNNIKWKEFEKLIDGEPKTAKEHMSKLGKALSEEVINNLSELIVRTKAIEKAIEENLKYSNTWLRSGTIFGTFFGVGTPKLWKKSLTHIKNLIQNAEKEEKAEENKAEAERNKAEEPNNIIRRSRSAPLATSPADDVSPSSSSPQRSASLPLPPLPPPPPNGIPKYTDSEIGKIRQLIDKFKKEAQNLNEEERKIKIKEIKEKAKEASNKYFGEKTPITLKILRKPDVKKVITKISKRTNQEKDFFWPLLLCNENMYNDLLRKKDAWQKASEELKVTNEKIYKKVKGGLGTVLNDKDMQFFTKLSEQVKESRKEFVNQLISMRKSGVAKYNELKKFKATTKAPKDLQNKVEKQGWAKDYLMDTESKQKIYEENLKKFVMSEMNAYKNLEDLENLKKDYESINERQTTLTNDLKTAESDKDNISKAINEKEEKIKQLTVEQNDTNKTAKDQKKISDDIKNLRKEIDEEEKKSKEINKKLKEIKYFNVGKKDFDEKYKRVQELINEYNKYNSKYQMAARNNKNFFGGLTPIFDKDGIKSSATLEILLKDLTKSQKVKNAGKKPEEMQELLKGVMDGKIKFEEVTRIDLSSLEM